MPSWQEFDKRTQTAAATAGEDDIADVCALVFQTAHGRELMKHLYATIVDKRCQPGASEATLREAEAQRRLVADLEKWRDSGIKRAAEKSKS